MNARASSVQVMSVQIRSDKVTIASISFFAAFAYPKVVGFQKIRTLQKR